MVDVFETVMVDVFKVVMSLRHCRFVVMCHVAVIASVVSLGLSQS
jgi:hypothetical protein